VELVVLRRVPAVRAARVARAADLVVPAAELAVRSSLAALVARVEDLVVRVVDLVVLQLADRAAQGLRPPGYQSSSRRSLRPGRMPIT